MKLGAGFLIACPNTQKILLALRNDSEPVWSIFGGTVENQETPIQCAKRELIEEAGFIEDRDYKIVSNHPIFIGKYVNFMYRTFLCVSEQEVIPTLNYEHLDYKWVALDEIPNNRHFGLQGLMADPKAMRKLSYMLNSKTGGNNG